MSWGQDPPYSCCQTIMYSKLSSRFQLICFSFLNTAHLFPCLSVLFLMFFGGRDALEPASLRIRAVIIQYSCICGGDLLHLNGQNVHTEVCFTQNRTQVNSSSLSSSSNIKGPCLNPGCISIMQGGLVFLLFYHSVWLSSASGPDLADWIIRYKGPCENT